MGQVANLKEARAAVDFTTLARGLEDDQSYVVVPAGDIADDLVWFVDKADGKVHPEVAFEQFERTGKMVLVVS